MFVNKCNKFDKHVLNYHSLEWGWGSVLYVRGFDHAACPKTIKLNFISCISQCRLLARTAIRHAWPRNKNPDKINHLDFILLKLIAEGKMLFATKTNN